MHVDYEYPERGRRGESYDRPAGFRADIYLRERDGQRRGGEHYGRGRVIEHARHAVDLEQPRQHRAEQEYEERRQRMRLFHLCQKSSGGVHYAQPDGRIAARQPEHGHVHHRRDRAEKHEYPEQRQSERARTHLLHRGVDQRAEYDHAEIRRHVPVFTSRVTSHS